MSHSNVPLKYQKLRALADDLLLDDLLLTVPAIAAADSVQNST